MLRSARLVSVIGWHELSGSHRSCGLPAPKAKDQLNTRAIGGCQWVP